MILSRKTTRSRYDIVGIGVTPVLARFQLLMASDVLSFSSSSKFSAVSNAFVNAW